MLNDRWSLRHLYKLNFARGDRHCRVILHTSPADTHYITVATTHQLLKLMFWCVYGAGLLDCQRWSRPRWRQKMTVDTKIGRASAADDRSVTVYIAEVLPDRMAST